MSGRDKALSNTIIHEMFVHTADENYMVARWCFDNGLMTDFFWNAVHSLEKYMKAALLTNDVSVKKFRHGLVEMYAEIEKLALPLLPSLLTKPSTLEIRHWIDLTPTEFLEKLDSNGNADNRYLTYGYAQHMWYLHMLDAMVWTIRRLITHLDDPVISRREVPQAPLNREILANQADYHPSLYAPLDNIINAPDSPLRRAALNNNNAFAPDDYRHEPRRSGTSGRNSVLLRRIMQPLQSGVEDNAREGYKIAEWLLANTRQPGAVQQEIEQEMATARATFPAIALP